MIRGHASGIKVCPFHLQFQKKAHLKDERMDNNTQVERQIGKNAVLNIIKNIVGFVTPLITFPYISRVLMPDNVGKITAPVYQGSLTSGPQTSASCQISSSVRLGIKCTINIMHLNHPQTHPLHKCVKKLSSLKSVPGAKKVGTTALH